MTTTPVAKPRRSGRLRGLLGYLILSSGKPGEIMVISHSNLFYWWPVWFTGFLLAGYTYFWDDNRLAVVPPGTVAAKEREVEVEQGKEGKPGKRELRDVLILPAGKHHAERPATDGAEPGPEQPRIHLAQNKNLGIIFLIVLFLVIIVTNIPLRGLWSVVIVMVVVMGSIILVQSGWWSYLINRSHLLGIYINMAGYLLISIALLTLWFLSFFFFDRQIYMVFCPGQCRLRTQVGGGETMYDTTGMVFQKQRSDLFRHWILGFGSGDLIIRTSGGKEHFDLPNVMHVGRKVKAIENLIKEKEIVAR
jgi:hypothetical protein